MAPIMALSVLLGVSCTNEDNIGETGYENGYCYVNLGLSVK